MGDQQARPDLQDRSGAEHVTADERRRRLEEMAFGTEAEEPALDPMILGAIGQAAVDPAGERFAGESRALAAIVAAQSTGCAFETRVLAESAIEVWSSGNEGSNASRTALLRATAAFLLHRAATVLALASSQLPPHRASPEGRASKRYDSDGE